MGNCCAKGAEEETLKTEEKTFKWTIDGFSSLLDKGQGWTNSRVFEFMGLNWCLKLKPKDRKCNDEKEHVSLMLVLAQSSVKLDTVIEASFKFLIYDQCYGKHMEQLDCKYKFCHLMHDAPGNAEDLWISCQQQLDIKVATIKTNATLETLFVEKMNIEAKVYTWEIEDYFALKNPSYSPEFELTGYRWYIRLKPSSDGKHLSLFLCMNEPNDLSKDSGKLTEVSLSIKDLENGKDLKSTGRVQYSNKHSRWGWPKFISLEDFKDASKGYLIKGKCCIEAEVALVGSSKTQ